MAWYTHLNIGRTKPDGTIHDFFRIFDCIYQGQWNKPLTYRGQWYKGRPLIYRFDNIDILRYLAGKLTKDIQTHKAWLNRGKWKL